MNTLRLLFPEWQGYGEDARVAEGARLICKSFSKGIDFEEVQIPEDLKEPRSIVAAIKRSGASNLYIRLDLDFFDPLDFPCALVPTTGGIRMNDL